MTHRHSFVLPNRFRAAVFDVDGLLVATEGTWAEAEHTIEAYRKRLGLPESAHDTMRAELMANLRARLTTIEAQPGAQALVTALARPSAAGRRVREPAGTS